MDNQLSFNFYSGLTHELKQELMDIEELVKDKFRNFILEVGEKLIRVQEIMRYGKGEAGFLAWIEAKTPFSKSSAYRAMAIARRFGDKKSFPSGET